MPRGLVIITLVALATMIGVGQTDRSEAAFHIMRVYGVMGGAFGDGDVQYVELRQAASGQNFVAGHELCFFDSTGAPWARFTFPAMVSNGANGASILIGSSEFDADWDAGAPDFVFSAANTVAINGAADVNHPIPVPAGKVSFGSDSATVPASMCAGSYFFYDSVAYGDGIADIADWGTPLDEDLPTENSDAIRLQGAVTAPGAGLNNSINYAITDVNSVGDYPRNNAGNAGPIGGAPPPDSDGDTLTDDVDNCPSWPNPGQNLPSWPVPGGDDDCDGWSTANETTITTQPHDACGFTAGGAPESETWPPDLSESNSVNIADVVALKPYFGQPSPPARFDLSPSGSVNIADVTAVKPIFGKSCTP